MTIGKKFIAPALAVPSIEYDQRQQSQLIRELRLYFNLLDNYFSNTILDALNGGIGSNTITFPHIAASDSPTVVPLYSGDQYATGNNVPTPVKWNTLDSSFGWTLNAPGSATAAVAGVYKITYSLQLANTDNAIHDATVWLKVNNQDLANSATYFSVPGRKSAGNPSYISAYSEVSFSVNAEDEIELYWATGQAATSGGTLGVYIFADPAQTSPYARPAIPSAIGSITYVSALPQP